MSHALQIIVVTLPDDIDWYDWYLHRFNLQNLTHTCTNPFQMTLNVNLFNQIFDEELKEYIQFSIIFRASYK